MKVDHEIKVPGVPCWEMKNQNFEVFSNVISAVDVRVIIGMAYMVETVISLSYFAVF